MQGSRIGQLQRALREGAKYISPENSIGLVVFSSDVRVKLPIRPFKLLQKSAFLTAVDQLSANGGTAMYDGVAVSLSMLAEQVAKDPTLKPMLFVLTITLWSLAKLMLANLRAAHGLDIAFINAMAALALTLLALFLIASALIRVREERRGLGASRSVATT